MTKPPWLLRNARRTQRDRARLAAFQCADDESPFTLEVEHFIRDSVYDWAFAPGAQVDDPRLLLLFERESGQLIGVAAHERHPLLDRDGKAFSATKLEVVALARSWQGKTFTTGERASDVLMSGVMADVTNRVPKRYARIYAHLHEGKHLRRIRADA